MTDAFTTSARLKRQRVEALRQWEVARRAPPAERGGHNKQLFGVTLDEAWPECLPSLSPLAGVSENR
jgi:hypothetical protein